MTDSFKLDFNLIICVIVKKKIYTAKHSIRGQGFIYFEQEYNSHFLIMFAGMFGFIIGFLICLVLNVPLFFFLFFISSIILWAIEMGSSLSTTRPISATGRLRSECWAITTSKELGESNSQSNHSANK